MPGPSNHRFKADKVDQRSSALQTCELITELAESSRNKVSGTEMLTRLNGCVLHICWSVRCS